MGPVRRRRAVGAVDGRVVDERLGPGRDARLPPAEQVDLDGRDAVLARLLGAQAVRRLLRAAHGAGAVPTSEAVMLAKSAWRSELPAEAGRPAGARAHLSWSPKSFFCRSPFKPVGVS